MFGTAERGKRSAGGAHGAISPAGIEAAPGLSGIARRARNAELARAAELHDDSDDDSDDGIARVTISRIRSERAQAILDRRRAKVYDPVQEAVEAFEKRHGKQRIHPIALAAMKAQGIPLPEGYEDATSSSKSKRKRKKKKNKGNAGVVGGKNDDVMQTGEAAEEEGQVVVREQPAKKQKREESPKPSLPKRKEPEDRNGQHTRPRKKQKRPKKRSKQKNRRKDNRREEDKPAHLRRSARVRSMSQGSK